MHSKMRLLLNIIPRKKHYKKLKHYNYFTVFLYKNDSTFTLKTFRYKDKKLSRHHIWIEVMRVTQIRDPDWLLGLKIEQNIN